eukprot:jgi/Tetstr1/422448/TSEL_013286.t1
MARADVRAWAEYEADPDADDVALRPPTRILLALLDVREGWNKARRSADSVRLELLDLDAARLLHDDACRDVVPNLELPTVEQLAKAFAATISQRINIPPELQYAQWLTGTMMAAGVEMQQYHTEPKLLRLGDDNLCAISLGKEAEEFADTLRLVVALSSLVALLRAVLPLRTIVIYLTESELNPSEQLIHPFSQTRREEQALHEDTTTATMDIDRSNLELPTVEQLAKAFAATISQRIKTPPELQYAQWLTDTMMAVDVETQQYHTEPKLLRVGDDNLYAISLGKEAEETEQWRKTVSTSCWKMKAVPAQAEDEDELELSYEENDITMDVGTAQRGAAEAPGKGKAATFAKHKKKHPRGRSRSRGATRNRNMSKPRLYGTRDSDSKWETDDEAAQPSGNSHQYAMATPTLELDAGANASAPMWAAELRAAHTRVVEECGDAVLEDLAGPLASALKLLPSKRSHVARAGCSAAGAEPASAMRSAADLRAIPHYSDFPLHSMRKVQETLSHRIHTVRFAKLVARMPTSGPDSNRFRGRLLRAATAFLVTNPPSEGRLGEVRERSPEYYDSMFRVAACRPFGLPAAPVLSLGEPCPCASCSFSVQGMLARFEDAGVEFTPSTWAVAYADHVARCSGGVSNHAAHEWAAHGLSDICHDVKSALGVGVQILTDPSVLVSLPKGSDGRPADVGLFGYGGIRGNTVAIDTTIAPILGVSSSDPTTALRAAERHKIQKYDEGVRNAAGMLRFVPFAVSEFGSLAPHAEAFLVELAKASHTHTGQKIGQLLSAWRRRFSLLINMAHADNVLGGVASARAARDGTPAPASRRSSACVAMTRVIGCKRPRRG